MKKPLKILIGALLPMIAVFGVVSGAHAAWSDDLAVDNERIVLAKDQTHEGSYYTAGKNIEIAGTINGDLHCAGEKITITGVVNGDVLCAASDIDLSDATVSQDVRLAAQQIAIDAKIGGNATTFAQNVEVKKSTEIEGDINGAMQFITIDGMVKKNVRIAGQTLSVGGVVAGDVDAALQKIALEDDAKISGNLNYSADLKLEIDESKVSGSVSYNKPGKTDAKDAVVASLFSAVVYLASAILFTSMMVVLVAPRFVERSNRIASKSFGTVLLVGTAITFGTPFLIMALGITIVGVPFAIAVGLAWVATMIVSVAFFAYWLGAFILKNSDKILMRMLVGCVLAVALYIIPVVNVIVFFAAGIIGSGMLVKTLTNGYRSPSYHIDDLDDESKHTKKKVK